MFPSFVVVDVGDDRSSNSVVVSKKTTTRESVIAANDRVGVLGGADKPENIPTGETTDGSDGDDIEGDIQMASRVKPTTSSQQQQQQHAKKAVGKSVGKDVGKSVGKSVGKPRTNEQKGSDGRASPIPGRPMSSTS